MARPPTPLRKKPATKHSKQELLRIADEAAQKVLDSMAPLGDPCAAPSELIDTDVETWIKSRGWTPLEFLTHTYRNGYQKMEHRISAAKAVLEYAHRKLPQKIEAEVIGRNITLDAAALTKLDGKELELLESLLNKVSA